MRSAGGGERGSEGAPLRRGRAAVRREEWIWGLGFRPGIYIVIEFWAEMGRGYIPRRSATK